METVVVVLVIFSLAISVRSQADQQCAAKMYKLSTKRTVFSEARKQCRSFGDLAEINSPAEEQTLATLLLTEDRANTPFFVGASNRHDDTRMIWETSSNPLATSYYPRTFYEDRFYSLDCVPKETCLVIIVPRKKVSEKALRLIWDYVDCSQISHYICEQQTRECALPIQPEKDARGNVRFPNDTIPVADAMPLQVKKREDCFIISKCKKPYFDAQRRCKELGYGDLTLAKNSSLTYLRRAMVFASAYRREFLTGRGLESNANQTGMLTLVFLRQQGTSFVVNFKEVRKTDKYYDFICESQTNDCKDLVNP